MADTSDPDDLPPEGLVLAEPLRRALGERYLQYALSTIMHRALPDARDGLKPVHRRLLWAMRLLKLDPSQGFKKSARVVGDVIGKYHPHGDQSVYDALVRLAQGFAARYPLVDGQGNFGNIDGDGAAAMRYTEAKLTAVAVAMMDGLDEDAVDFRLTYDGADEEPIVMPGAFPNLLANGSNGIAVGMATSIPPHNAGEVIEAALHLVKHPDAKVETLLEKMPGPDFPTGGVLVESRDSIVESYRTGRGSFRLRARWVLEDLGRGQWRLVVLEIPYQVQKSRLIEKIADLITNRKLPILGDIRDESAEDIRIVLEPKTRNVDPAVLMEHLFRLTDLEVRAPLNMNVLIDGKVPKVCGLIEVLRAWLDHQREVLLRRAAYRLGKIKARLETLEGYIVAFLNLDRVIEIIRYDDDPKAGLMAEDWAQWPEGIAAHAADAEGAEGAEGAGGAGGPLRLSDGQAEAILNMRLRSLRRLEEMELRAERERLMAERAGLTALVGDEVAQWTRITGDLKAMRDKFGAPRKLRGVTFADDLARLKDEAGEAWPLGARRTGFADTPKVNAAPPESFIEREPITVICSAMGWVRALKGHGALDAELKFKDGDGPRFAFHAETTDKVLLLGSSGRFFTLPADRLPGGRGMGEPLRLMVDLPNEDEIVAMFVHRPGARLLLATDMGDGFIAAQDEVLAQTRAGRQVLNVKAPARAILCRPAPEGADAIAVIGANRKMLVFPIDQCPQLTRGKGLRLQRYKDGGLSDALAFTLADGLKWSDGGGRTRHQADLTDWLGDRASAGRMAPRGFPRDNRFP
jgi:topoisomerase-4 subunit A